MILQIVKHLAAGPTLDADRGSNGAPIHNRLPRRLICRPDDVVEITSSGYWKYARGHHGKFTEARHPELSIPPWRARLGTLRGARSRCRPRSYPIGRPTPLGG